MMDDQAEDSIALAALEPVPSGVALLFAEGQRPTIEDVDRLITELSAGQMLSAGYRDEAIPGRLELVCRGLTFDLGGLAPASAAPLPTVTQNIGLGDDLPQVEAVTLMAGRHLEDGAHLPPVLRTHLEVALALAALPGLQAMMWAPSGVMMSPAHCVQTIRAWLDGGPFPAPGLVALLREEDGTLLSHGLSFFAPYQLRVEAADECREAQEEIASALVRRLADGDGHVPAWMTGRDGRVWNVSWSAGQRLVTARRSA
ncbi:hypothetical protein [Novosphingobium terrae]|uniref:hypothetical protein n=1 Tax=Novosphingobium terrae TaxID=2726189 RepID=UPI00197EBD6A|nr:hypothetical protein [Novosphingobium terrae]